MKKAELKQATFKSYNPTKADLNPKWVIVDAKDKILGKAATQIADMLRGKNKASFSNHLNCGDFVIVINAAQVKLTGKKEQQKNYYRHSGFPGGLKTINVEKLRAQKPEKIIEHAVAGMLPNNKNKKELLKRLRIFAGEEHSHSAQQPTEKEL